MKVRDFHSICALVGAFACICVAPIPIARAQATLTGDAPAAQGGLSARLDTLLSDAALKGSITGVEIARLDDGRVVFARNESIRLMPASNRKLFTAATALRFLGPDHQFKTQVTTVSQEDSLSAGILQHGVCLKGDGDAALTTKDLDALADQLYLQGIRAIHGNVYGDGTVFLPGTPYGDGWSWDYLSDDYAAAVAGLEVNDGDFTVIVTGGKNPGDPATVTLDPPVSMIPVINVATTSGGASPANTLNIKREWDRDTVTVGGAVPAGKVVKQVFAIADPVRYAADCFRLALVRRGITVDGHAVALSAKLNGTQVLAEHESEPLLKYLALMLKPSDNLIAESLMRAVGQKVSGVGTYDAGREAEIGYLKSLGITLEECDLCDGSGVSRKNNVTASAVCRLLETLGKAPVFAVLYDDLPIGGVDGTLRRRFMDQLAATTVHAKTGTLTGACALSGYVKAKSGNTYIFSVLMNNYSCKVAEARSLQDRIVEEVARSL